MISRGGLFKFQTPPRSSPPKVVEPVFLQVEIFGESVGTKGVKFFFNS